MDCEVVQKFLQVYVDGEFDEAERHEVESHLSTCPTCRARAEYERRFRDAIRTRLVAPAAPEGLRDRIKRDMAEYHSPRHIPRSLMWGSIPAAAALIMVTMFTWTVTSGFTPIVEEAVSKHSSAPPVEVSSANSDDVENWFRSKVNFNVALPHFSARQMYLEGGRLSNLAQRRAALIRYRRGPRHFSLFVITDGNVKLGGQRCKRLNHREFCLSENRGYAVVSWKARGLLYSMVGDSSADELLNMLSTADSD